MSDVIVVLGMHRSGTSAVAGTLMQLGGSAPSHLMAASASNARGHFESQVLTEFDDELLSSAGSHWQDWRPFNPGWQKSPVALEYRERAKELFREEFDGSALPVFKDPRICRFFPFWLDVLRELKATTRIVMPIRSPLDVALSLKERDGIPLIKGMLLWLRHVLDAEIQSRNEARSIFAWSDFIADWRAVCDKVSADTGITWPRLSDRTSRGIDLFLSKALVHHGTNYAELVAHSNVHEWTLRAYEALLELARNPFSNSALDTLDQLRALLEQSSRLFGRILVDYEVELEDLRDRALALTGERDQLRLRQDEILAEGAAVTAELAARDALADAALAEAEKALSAAVSDTDALSKATDALSKALAAATAERDALHEVQAQIAAELDAQQREIVELAARAEAAEAAANTAGNESGALSEALATAAAERDALRGEQARIAAELDARRQDAVDLADARRDLGAASRKHAEALAALDLARGETEAQAAARAGLAADLDRAAEEKRRLAAAHDLLAAQLAETAAALESSRGETAAQRAARADAAAELDRAVEEKQSLSAARDLLAGELAKTRRQFVETAQKQAESLAALESARGENATLEAVRADLAADLDRASKEKSRLAVDLDRLSSEWQRATRISGERAAAQEAAHAQALAAARKAHAAEIQALRGTLVDTEAALAHAAAARAPGRLSARRMLASFRRRRLAKRLVRSGLFDPEFYAATHPDVRARGPDAALHYLEQGFCRGYRPNPYFDTRWYIERYEDVRRSGVNPLLHYLVHGYREGRDPGPDFHTDFYLEDNPDVRATGMNPLAHYLRYGRHEGRLPTRPARG